MHLSTIISLFAGIVAVSAAPSALVPRAPVLLGEVCTDINFKGSCITFVAAGPFTAGTPGAHGCADNTAPFIKTISSARGLTDGYTCFLYSELKCAGKRVVISGQIPDFRAPNINFNDKALSWSCDSALTSI
ncbi:hypothetical protein C8J57DRAFT_1277706 [Mycena rebaudengoi]|nr:hypothetical protein C8J57DRAFT_1277706 [Mycena rebaudengoi]